MRASRIVSVSVALSMLTLGLAPGSAAMAAQDSSRPPKPPAPETLKPHPNWRPADKPLAPISVPSHRSTTLVAEPDPKAHRVREVTGLRTATGRYYQLSDGRVQAEISGTPVNYRDARGGYQPVDVRVTGAGRAGYPHGVEKNTFRSYFGDRTDRMVRLEYEGTSLGLGTTATTAATPQVRGNQVTYRGALPGGTWPGCARCGSRTARSRCTAPTARAPRWRGYRSRT